MSDCRLHRGHARSALTLRGRLVFQLLLLYFFDRLDRTARLSLFFGDVVVLSRKEGFDRRLAVMFVKNFTRVYPDRGPSVHVEQPRHPAYTYYFVPTRRGTSFFLPFVEGEWGKGDHMANALVVR